MTHQRANYLYQFLGQITSKKLRKNQRYSQHFYQLNLLCSNHPELTKIFAFRDKIHNPQIWPTLESDRYLGKTYLFYCRNYRGSYYLINWKELPPNEPSNKPQTFDS